MSNNGKKKTIELKILLIGDSDVGKTTLLLNYLRGEFIVNLDVTWKGVNLFRKMKSVENPKEEPINYYINIWDIAGSENYLDFFSLITEPMDAIIIQTDSDMSTIEYSIKKWYDTVKNFIKSNFNTFLLVTKRDNIVEEKKIEVLSKEFFFNHYFILDSKNSEEVNKVFDIIFNTIIEH